MNHPQFIIEFSTELLTTLFHNIAGTLLPCPTGSNLYTDLIVDSVVPMPGDTEVFFAQETFKNLGIPITETRRIKTTPYFNPVLPARLEERIVSNTRRTFLLVSGEIKTFCDINREGCVHDLLTERTSDTVPPTQFLFPNQNFAGLLFSVDAEADSAGTGANLKLQFMSLFSSNSLAPFSPDFQKQNNFVKNLLNQPIIRPLPLQDILGSLGVSNIVNAGVTTELWKEEDKPPKGLRIGFDATRPDDSNGWEAGLFHSNLKRVLRKSRPKAERRWA